MGRTMRLFLVLMSLCSVAAAGCRDNGGREPKPSTRPDITSSLLVHSLLADSRNDIWCAVRYLAGSGGPAEPSPWPESL